MPTILEIITSGIPLPQFRHKHYLAHRRIAFPVAGFKSAQISGIQGLEELETDRCTVIENEFDFVVQGILGVCAFCVLLLKRQFEHPLRPTMVWLYDTTKQGVAALFVHFFNVAAARILPSTTTSTLKTPYGSADECDFYFINFMIDVTLGVFFIYGFLVFFMKIARCLKLEIRETGDYGSPPKSKEFLKQLTVFSLVVIISKIVLLIIEIQFSNEMDAAGVFVFGGFDLGPRTKLMLVMVIGPLVMNALQFWVIDNFLKVKDATSATCAVGAVEKGQGSRSACMGAAAENGEAQVGTGRNFSPSNKTAELGANAEHPGQQGGAAGKTSQQEVHGSALAVVKAARCEQDAGRLLGAALETPKSR